MSWPHDHDSFCDTGNNTVMRWRRQSWTVFVLDSLIVQIVFEETAAKGKFRGIMQCILGDKDTDDDEAYDLEDYLWPWLLEQ